MNVKNILLTLLTLAFASCKSYLIDQVPTTVISKRNLQKSVHISAKEPFRNILIQEFKKSGIRVVPKEDSDLQIEISNIKETWQGAKHVFRNISTLFTLGLVPTRDDYFLSADVRFSSNSSDTKTSKLKALVEYTKNEGWLNPLFSTTTSATEATKLNTKNLARKLLKVIKENYYLR